MPLQCAATTPDPGQAGIRLPALDIWGQLLGDAEDFVVEVIVYESLCSTIACLPHLIWYEVAGSIVSTVACRAVCMV